MSRIYDKWERLVCAILRREHDRELAYAPSLGSSFNSSTSADFSTRFSFDSQIHEVDFCTRFSFDSQIHEVDFSTRFSFDSPTHQVDFDASGNPVRYIDFEELRKATRNFRSLILGDGGFNGCLFKGWIDETTLTAAEPEFGIAVTVKKLNQVKGRDRSEWQEWSAEINYGQLRHPNLVKLIGYSSKGDVLLLVYEFVVKGSLDDHLYGKLENPFYQFEDHESLSWTTRIKVALDVARAFSFLHGMQPQVIHRNCKPANIFLDEDFNAKLFDFGLAINCPPGDMTHVRTEIMGTLGYAAPEYIATGRLTAKCDVYGFGVVLLGLLSGRRGYDLSREVGERRLVDWAKPDLLNERKSIRILDLVEWLKPYLGNKKKFIQFMDPKLAGQYTVNKAYRIASIALHCLSPESKGRPRMSEVVVALEQI